MDAREPVMDSEPFELVVHLLPADGDVTPAEIYQALALMALDGVNWHGYTTEPLAFGLESVNATCVCVPKAEGMDAYAIVEAAEQLLCVQSASNECQRSWNGEDMFERCWLNPPRRVPRGQECMKCAIVTTLKKPFCLDSWVRYHLAVGFEHIFLYLDSPEDDAESVARIATSHPGAVTVIPRDEKLREEWRQLAGWRQMEHIIDLPGDLGAVMARQVLNGEHAAHLADKQGLDWLLHCDCDELACPTTEGTTIAQVLAGVSAAGGNAAVFANHEVTPEKEGPYADPFKEATLFKANERLVPADLGEGGTRFLAYGNGKSAIRLGLKNPRPHGTHSVVGGARPAGVHKWICAQPAVFLLHPDDACLLHYVNCGFDAIERRYAMLGDFADTYFGHRIADQIPFHAAARDAAKQGREVLLELYKEQVMFDLAKATLLLASGNCIRVTVPQNVLCGH